MIKAKSNQCKERFGNSAIATHGHSIEIRPEYIVRETKYTDRSSCDCAPRTNIGDRIHTGLSSKDEVVTAFDDIDLLAESEVKDISDPKEALGKILAFWAFFPSHDKRLNLFGRPDLTKLALAQATCAYLYITVTFEEVK